MRFPIGDPALFDRAKKLRRCMTDAEHVLWRELKGRAFGMRFRRQEPMLAFILDFYAPSIQLAIEVDGPVHARDVDYDRERDARLTEIGVRVLRFENDEVIGSLRSVVERIRNAVEEQSRVRDSILAKREAENAAHRAPCASTYGVCRNGGTMRPEHPSPRRGEWKGGRNEL